MWRVSFVLYIRTGQESAGGASRWADGKASPCKNIAIDSYDLVFQMPASSLVTEVVL